MKDQKKTLVSGLVALLLGASCCWISSLVVWVGSASFLGLTMQYAESFQLPLLGIGLLLITTAFFKFRKKRNKLWRMEK